MAAAIARLRNEHGLKQTDIQGISERQLRRIARGGDVSVQSLKVLADAHGMKLDRYLHAIAESLVPPTCSKNRFSGEHLSAESKPAQAPPII